MFNLLNFLLHDLRMPLLLICIFVQGIRHAAEMVASGCQFYVTRKLANGKQAASQIVQQVRVTIRLDQRRRRGQPQKVKPDNLSN